MKVPARRPLRLGRSLHLHPSAPYFDDMVDPNTSVQDLAGLRALAMLGDSVTTDHISPAGNIAIDSPAGEYLMALGVKPGDFNSYGARRGNHEVMVRGTFANIRLAQLARARNRRRLDHATSRRGEQMFIYDASMRYQKEGTPLFIIAGKEYGTGSSRDWAAKGTLLLGVKRRDRRKLRAHPPLESGGHGRAARCNSCPRPEPRDRWDSPASSATRSKEFQPPSIRRQDPRAA